MPYNEWFPCNDTQPSNYNFIKGESGVIYPPGFVKYLQQQGKGFKQNCDYADDIWLSVSAIRSSFKVARVEGKQCKLMVIPGTQVTSLSGVNVLCGHNQMQLRMTCSEADMSALLAHEEPGIIVN
jgi:hypothetical protein